ncbi:unnamed protein product [Mytilus coruscus]|uniref:LRRCT domain-containing protein n=1 Tax=Mytilus coruscus TaxID=42192 RepID=A0A6J8AG68_MYTCO|nr:unnamed protein product [Mytilus coruscus]
MDMFYYLSGANIALSLRNNLFHKLNSSLFLPIANLRKLQVEENEIVYVDFNGLMTTGFLDLSNNNIYAIPNFCNNSDETFVSHLKYLSLAYNAIRKISKESFKCLVNLDYLIMDGNRFRSLDNNAFALLHNLRKLVIGDNQQLKDITAFAFNSSSLQVLHLYRNNFRYSKKKYKEKRFNPQTIFQTIPNLKEVDLSHNYLNEYAIVRELFASTRHIHKLTLVSSDITTIPEELLRNMPHIESLNLQGNEIERWNVSLFENSPSMRELYLDGNNIHVVNETSFPANLLKSLEVLELSGNQYPCTCEIKWFLDTIRSTNFSTKMQENWPSRYTCYYPEHLRLTLLADYLPTVAECNSLNIRLSVNNCPAAQYENFGITIIRNYHCCKCDNKEKNTKQSGNEPEASKFALVKEQDICRHDNNPLLLFLSEVAKNLIKNFKRPVCVGSLHLSKEEVNRFLLDNFSDLNIDAYFETLKSKSENNIFLPAVWYNATFSSTFGRKPDTSKAWLNTYLFFVPANFDSNHWVLIVIKPK